MQAKNWATIGRRRAPEVDTEVCALGTRIVAFTPELERYTRNVHNNLNLTFDILTDLHLKTADTTLPRHKGTKERHLKNDRPMFAWCLCALVVEGLHEPPGHQDTKGTDPKGN